LTRYGDALQARDRYKLKAFGDPGSAMRHFLLHRIWGDSGRAAIDFEAQAGQAARRSPDPLAAAAQQRRLIILSSRTFLRP
jgi:hypothetical protein